MSDTGGVAAPLVLLPPNVLGGGKGGMGGALVVLQYRVRAALGSGFEGMSGWSLGSGSGGSRI